ncbi:hypothetical protein EMPS_00329 [Entomortierella parvispora]|uniref:Uncharacterized protein n=1 Tax=Entomortierella parvispora TaxID=205924 RepID=A0A9P3H0H3_9FUNG|nr:hypothetical protein EMPS_00329 [Entomortierella parvispora]
MRPCGRRLALVPASILFLLVFSSLIPPVAHAQISRDDRAGLPTATGPSLVPHTSTLAATTTTRPATKPTVKPPPGAGGGGGGVVTSSAVTKTVAGSPAPSALPPVVTKRCKDCLSPASGQTCYQNTQCIPLTLLCNNSTNPCVDGDGTPPSSNPVNCAANQLCYASTYLPLPNSIDSMDQNVQRNSSSNCLAGSYFSLFGYISTTTNQSVVRYTESCAGVGNIQNEYSSPPTCQAWEYQVENACFLKTCNEALAMQCEAPFECKKQASANGYGLCWNPNSTVPDPSDDGNGYQDPKEKLIQGLLIGICSLILIVGVGLGLWHYRKKRSKRMAALRDGLDPNSGRRHHAYMGGGSTGTKEGLWQRLTSCGRRRKSPSDPDGQQDDDGVHHGLQPTSTRESREMRVVSLTESEGNESSLLVGNDHNRSHLIFARRWRWGGGAAGQTTPGGQEGGPAVMPEIEPPPMYHDGGDLPVYRDRNSILMPPVSEPLPSGSAAIATETAAVRQNQEQQHQPQPELVHESTNTVDSSHEQDQHHPLQLSDPTQQPLEQESSNSSNTQQPHSSATITTPQDHTQV